MNTRYGFSTLSAALGILSLTLGLTLVSCGEKIESDAVARKMLSQKQIGILDSFQSAALAKNTLKEKTRRTIHIIVPESYYTEAESRYPVVYFLHGFDESPDFLWKNRKYIAKLMADGTLPEMILVEPDCWTKLGGGFYANSPVTGFYEDYLTRELVAFIDANFRTIPETAARGLAGFSMGGFGALSQGLKHPDVYGAVFSLSPGVLAPDGLAVAMKDWAGDSKFLKAYAAVFSPAKRAVPKLDGSAADNAVCADWNSGFGDWDARIAAYQAQPARLSALRIECGDSDKYRFIREGCAYIDTALTAAGIEHQSAVFSGGHRLTLSKLADDILPFMGANLAVKWSGDE